MRPPTRREFLAASSASVLAAGGLARGDEPAVKPSSANDAITLGFIGVGGMGTGLLNIFRKMPDVRVAAVCDVDESHLGKAKDTAGAKTAAYSDFRKVLDRKDVDAVVVATPDHWHAIPTILACQAGKDVYCEKPLSFRIGEGRAMADAAAKYKRVTQMGNLIHAGDNYRRVVEIVRSGVLGPIFRTNVWMANHQFRYASPPDTAPPAGLDYDFWLGPAPKRAYNPNRSHFSWRYFWDYGGGVLCDFVCHIVDLVHWAMDVSAPSTIAATGGRFVSQDNAETPDTLEVIYHYPKPGGPGFTMVWTQTDRSAFGPEGKHLGIMFQGTNGTLISDYSSYKILSEKGRTIDLPMPSIPKSVGHHREWLDAIKSRGTTSCHFGYGHRLSSVGHLGNIALRTGESLAWDAKAEKVTNHPEANQHLWRTEYRAPWSIPKV